MRRAFYCISVCFLLLFATARHARAEDGSAAWLRYAPVANAKMYASLPSRIVVFGNTPTDKVAAEELRSGLTSMLRRSFTVQVRDDQSTEPGNAIYLLSQADLHSRHVVLIRTETGTEGFSIADFSKHGDRRVAVVSGTARGELYGVFHLLERVAAQKPILDETQTPAAPIRWSDEWDNPNGTVERGYAGPSIFFENGHVKQDLTRAGEYARLLASVGINGCNVNNVNAAPGHDDGRTSA